MTEKRPTFLITNDDSVYSKGICELINVAREIGNVVVVAPDSGRSGMSSAITHSSLIHLNRLHEEVGFSVYSCNGTPVDCVKLALFALFDKEKPDFLISGINHGSNASVNAMYSATVGATMEGCINGIPSMALSLCDHDENADFSILLPFVKTLLEKMVQNPVPYGTFLNVNFPKGEVRGVKVCRQADSRWSEEYDCHISGYGDKVYLLKGYFSCREPKAEDADVWTLEHGYASLVPVKVDMTNYSVMEEMTRNFTI